MYIKSSTSVPQIDRNPKSGKVHKKTDSGSNSFKDLLEEIDIIELSTELDPDEKRKSDLRKKEQEKSEAQQGEVVETRPEIPTTGLNRIV